MGVEIEELTVADEPAAWAAAGFAVEGDVCDVGRVPIRLAGRDAGRGLARWTLRGAGSTELDGLPTADGGVAEQDGPSAGAEGLALSERAADGSGGPSHPNGVSAVDHVVAMTPDLDRTVAALTAAGLDLRRVREEPTPAGAPRQAFFRLGVTILEVVQEPPEAVERGGGPERPAFFWGLAFLAPDLDASVAQLGPELVSEARPAVQPGRRIATLRRAAGLALPVALISPRQGSPGRPAAAPS